jgi:ribosomal protein L32
MAVPKKRTSRARQGQRRSHLALKVTGLNHSGATAVPRRLARAIKLGLVKID